MRDNDYLELSYDDFDKLVNLKETNIRRVEQPCFFHPSYENGHLGKHGHECKSMIIDGITSDYTIKDIMKNSFDSYTRELFFKDVKRKIIEMGLTHFYSLTFKDNTHLDNGAPVTRVLVRGICDDYTKLINKKQMIQENLNEILLDEDKPKKEE